MRLNFAPGSARYPVTAKQSSRLFRAVFMLLVSLLAGCGVLIPAPPTSTPAASPLPPRPLPSPTARILTSDELYRDDPGLIGRTDPQFASLPVDAVLPPVRIGPAARQIKVVLADDAVVLGERFGFGQPRRPGLLVLGMDLPAWTQTAQRLADAGFVVIALQYRDWLQTRHIETLLFSLMAVDSVNADKLAIIGEAQTADLAFLGCAVNELCDAAALFSPTSRDTLLNMQTRYGDRPLWLAAGRSDEEAFQTASLLSQNATGDVVFHESATGRGD